MAAAYEFTTLTCVPGVVHYNGARIQLCDLPGIIEGAAKGRGRGRQVIAVARTADLVLMMLDANRGKCCWLLVVRCLLFTGLVSVVIIVDLIACGLTNLIAMFDRTGAAATAHR